MNKRLRKKYLKKHGLYVEPRETLDLNLRIAKFILPRLKLFKKLTICYPGTGDMDTPEKWDDALEKMIHAFELFIDNYNGPDINFPDSMKIWENDQVQIKEGLDLFAKWFQHLDW